LNEPSLLELSDELSQFRPSRRAVLAMDRLTQLPQISGLLQDNENCEPLLVEFQQVPATAMKRQPAPALSTKHNGRLASKHRPTMEVEAANH
jgi:hypothetical protein